MANVVIFTVLVCLSQLIVANVEKTIFVAPDTITVPQDASIDNLLLTSLNPGHLTVRTYLNASFPTEQNPHGQDTWVLLEGLTPSQRYELRVCWLATQPTSFWIYTYPLNTVFENADLITSLSTFAYARHAQLSSSDIDELGQRRLESRQSSANSMLFLRVQAAADYFSMNKTLMEQVPPVHVDLILDPYMLNIFPQSLLPTGIYIGVVAVFAWFLSGWAYRQIATYAQRNSPPSRSQHVKKIN